MDAPSRSGHALGHAILSLLILTVARMKLLIIGATGGVGLALCSQALAAGHAVTILARSPAKLPAATASAATVIKADALDAPAVAAAVQGQDAILVALGSRSLMFRQYDCSKGTDVLLGALKAAGSGAPPPRLLVCSSMGASESAPWIPGFVRWLLKHPLADKDLQEAAVRASGLPHVIVRPTGLNDAAARGPAAVAAVVGGAVPHNQISRSDVAAFMLGQLASDEYLGKAVGISWLK